MGTRNATGPGDEARVTRLWRDPAARDDLRAIGIERPEHLATTFLADAEGLRRFTDGSPPLTDDYPKRLSHVPPLFGHSDFAHSAWMDAAKTRPAFEASRFVARIWPASVRTAALGQFDAQQLVDRFFLKRLDSGAHRLPAIDDLLVKSDLRTLPLWLLGSTAAEQAAVERAADGGMRSAALSHALGVRALAERDFARAAERFADAQGQPGAPPEAFHYRVYALAMAGRLEEARRLLMAAAGSAPSTDAERWFLEFLAKRFGVTIPSS
jgi:hypothetical protein